jgi:hypothetical protein
MPPSAVLVLFLHLLPSPDGPEIIGKVPVRNVGAGHGEAVLET